MIMLFPLSVSGAAQRWFASLDPSRRRTWVDLGRPVVTTDPLPTHDTRAVPPPPGGCTFD